MSRGRPRQFEPDRTNLTVRVSAKTRAHLERIAERDKRSLSQTIELILERNFAPQSEEDAA